ncbi:MAG: hypothetical protein ABII06_19700 [Pseudomonadota bacterium]
MLKVKRADTTGVENGRVILRFLGDDDKRYDMSLSPIAVSEALVAIFQAAKSLPRNDQVTVEGTIFEGSLQFAVGHEMQPVFVLGIGGVEIPLSLSEQQLVSLHDDISKHISSMAIKH